MTLARILASTRTPFDSVPTKLELNGWNLCTSAHSISLIQH